MTGDYAGPPTGRPAPPGWQPSHIATEAAPRTLPEQDHGEIDKRERAARDVTLTVAAAAFLVVLGLGFLLVLR